MSNEANNENKTLDPKLEETLKGIWESLTDEQKEKVKACKTIEELTRLAGEEGVELPDELLDAVAGGYVHYNHSNDKESRFEVIDDKTGAVLSTHDLRGWAQIGAKDRGQSRDNITDEELDRLRKTGKISKC